MAFVSITPFLRLQSHPRYTPARCAMAPTYLSAAKSLAIDQALMSAPHNFSLLQLMELAGQAVAHAISRHYSDARSISLICGPGNNGGDGLVAARHLKHFGYTVGVFYPKHIAREPFPSLLSQLEALDIEIKKELPLSSADIIVDAIFGFSFNASGGIREPFGAFLQAMNEHPGKLVCVDVPSGWDIDGNGVANGAIRVPDMLVSLTGPKLCAKGLDMVHYVGGRFVPPRLCKELEFEVAEYKGAETVTRID